MFGDMRMGDCEYSTFIHYNKCSTQMECHPFATAFTALTKN